MQTVTIHLTQQDIKTFLLGIQMSNKQMTLRDFKQWLAGVEEMQGEEWVPSKEQWMKIREKIDSISEMNTGHNVIQRDHYPVAPAPHQPVQYPSAPPAGSNLDGAQPMQRPFIPPQPARLPPAMVTSADGTGKAVTPNIDTSDGSYNSLFT